MFEENKSSLETNTEYSGGALVAEYGLENLERSKRDQVAENFDIKLEVNIPKKLHELRNIYELILDPLEFDSQAAIFQGQNPTV